MAIERIENVTTWTIGGGSGYVHLDFENTTGDVTQFIYANSAPRTERITVYREPQHTSVGSFDIPTGTTETTRPAPNSFNMVKDAEGYWAFDPRWSWGAMMFAAS